MMPAAVTMMRHEVILDISDRPVFGGADGNIILSQRPRQLERRPVICDRWRSALSTFPWWTPGSFISILIVYPFYTMGGLTAPFDLGIFPFNFLNTSFSGRW